MTVYKGQIMTTATWRSGIPVRVERRGAGVETGIAASRKFISPCLRRAEAPPLAQRSSSYATGDGCRMHAASPPDAAASPSQAMLRVSESPRRLQFGRHGSEVWIPCCETAARIMKTPNVAYCAPPAGPATLSNTITVTRVGSFGFTLTFAIVLPSADTDHVTRSVHSPFVTTSRATV